MTGEHIELKDMERLAGISEMAPAELPGDLRAAKEHLRHCPECAATVLAFEQLRLIRHLRAQHTFSPCPSEQQWLTYAAGIATEEEAAELLDHAQGCAGCAESLKMAVEDLTQTVQVEEQNLKLLRSSTPEWQRNLARRISLQTGASKAVEKSGRQWWQRGNWRPMLLLAMAVLLVAVTLTGTWIYRRGTEDALLASAYNQRRVTDLHLPGGLPVPVYSPTLGQSEEDDVLPLLKLKERARQHLDRNSNDAYWQQVEGRIALAEGKGEKARQKLDLAFALNPALQEINFDLASAHFEIGAAAQKPSEFVAAADLFGQVIDDPAATELRASAYYNRAICWQRLGVYYKAVSDLQNSLRLEANAEWRSKIQSLLQELRSQEKNSEGNGSAHLDTSPGGFLQALKDDPISADAHYEIYFEQASCAWLLQRNARSEVALRLLAAMGIKHHDTWLRDLMKSRDHAESRSALEDMAKALQANMDGDADRALPSLSAAAALFQKSHNTAGLLRTRAEMLYTFQRMGRSDECTKIAAALAPQQQ
jgi:tetratricopeptide (TPR) repeat protein